MVFSSEGIGTDSLEVPYRDGSKVDRRSGATLSIGRGKGFENEVTERALLRLGVAQRW